MSILKKHIATVDDNLELKFQNIASLKQDLLNLKNNDVEITVKKYRKHRSRNQNAYYWGVVCHMFSDCIGCEKQEAHNALAQRFLSKKLDCGLLVIKSTASLDTAEMEAYLNDCRMLASTMFTCYIPLPDEVTF